MAVVPLPFDGGNTGRAGLDLGDAVVGRIVVCNVYKEGYTMPEFNAVENTLFIPMLGRIYASEYFQNILYDEKALSLKDMLPKSLMETGSQNQYTLLASASRSANMDRYIRDFLRRKPDGIIAELGCGLETTFYRNDDGHTRWYAVDLPDVMEYRKTLLPEPERQTYFADDAFSDDWLRRIRIDAPDAPVLVTAGGLFHYFEEEKVLALLRMLRSFGNMEVVFDSVNKSGMGMLRKKYMKQMGHADAGMFFYVDSAAALARKIGCDDRTIAEEPYYRHIDKTGLKLSTKLSMNVSDRFCMVKMVHVK